MKVSIDSLNPETLNSKSATTVPTGTLAIGLDGRGVRLPAGRAEGAGGGSGSGPGASMEICVCMYGWMDGWMCVCT